MKRNWFKRIGMLALVAALTLCLAACGGDDAGQETSPAAPKETAAAAPQAQQAAKAGG